MLYRANVLMYDRQTESLWSQARRDAVTGELAGTELTVLPSTLTTWKRWLARHPQSEVLSPETGYSRDYSHDPYTDYYAREKGFLSFFKPGPGEEEKALVAGITLGEKAKAYPLKLLRRRGIITDSLADRTLTISLSAENEQIAVHTEGGNELVPVVLYWFVWKSIYPDSGLYREKHE